MLATREANDRRAVLFGLATVLTWSTVATAFKLGLRHMDHIQLLLVANLVSVLALGLVMLVQGSWRSLPAAPRRQVLLAVGLGLLNPFAYYLILLKAYDLLPAQVAQPLNYTWALTLAWLSVPLLGQKLRLRDAVAGLVCYSGVVIIATRGDLASFRVDSPLGVGLALVSTVIWALYWIGNRRSGLEPVAGLFLGFAAALPFTLAVTLLFSDLRIAPAGWLAGAYVGCFEMGFTFVLWLTAMKLTSSTARVANLIFLSPFLSLVFIRFVLDEAIAPATPLGLVLIVGGLWWQGRRERVKQAS
ncbi:MAG: DMT family transporter [Krumholzibacteria bacterium]|nr:DMT family transporter [Candidatus Krumholzibacteria bacterium]